MEFGQKEVVNQKEVLNQVNKIKNKDSLFEIGNGVRGWFRKKIFSPQKILSKYLNPGMTVLDLGYWPEYFSIEIANIVGENGKVFVLDSREEILQRIKEKLRTSNVKQIIKLIKCDEGEICMSGKLDFIFEFRGLHEVLDQEDYLRKIKYRLKQNGKLLIIEPTYGVSRKSFKNTVKYAESVGLKIVEIPKIFMSRAVLMKLDN